MGFQSSVEFCPAEDEMGLTTAVPNAAIFGISETLKQGYGEMAMRCAGVTGFLRRTATKIEQTRPSPRYVRPGKIHRVWNMV
jgi:hypothetical protein